MLGASVRTAMSHLPMISAAIDSICVQFAPREVQLAQVLIEPSDQQTIDIYTGSGFVRMAELLYLHRTVRQSAPSLPPPPAGFNLDRYSSATHSGFAAAILASYQDSLDCPGLNGVRNIQDVIAGHKAAGEFDPNDWFLLTQLGHPMAVVLLNRTTPVDAMELVYLGVAPAARQKGLGNYLMQMALAQVRLRKLSALTLAVDSQNLPARRLYQRHGLQQMLSRVALMRDLVSLR